jgi:hypothetical protein
MITGLIIETAFHGPTDHRGSRISATCKRDSDRTFKTFFDYSHAVNSDQNHQLAAEKLMAAMEIEFHYEGCDPFRIVGCGYGGRSDRGYYFLINRGGA